MELERAMSESNTGSSLDATREIILELAAQAGKFGREAFFHQMDIGDRLTEAKELLKAQNEGKRGGFDEWCQAGNFPFSKEWRARLMKLASLRETIAAYIAEREDAGQPVTSKEWSVDGILAAVKAHEKAKHAGDGGEGGEGDGEGAGAGAEKAKKKSPAEILREQLAAALARVAELEEENAKLRGGKKGSKAKADPGAGAPGQGDSGPAPITAATKTRAKKVYAFLDPNANAPEGEVSAAADKLRDYADGAGMAVPDFLTACGLDPAHWTARFGA